MDNGSWQFEVFASVGKYLREQEDKIIRDLILSFGSRCDPILINEAEVTLEDIDKMMRQHEEKEAKRVRESTKPTEKGRSCAYTYEHQEEAEEA